MANSPCKVLKIHDLVTLYPFEGVINRTSLIVIEKKGETEFPIPCVMWNNPRSRGMNQEAKLEEVMEATKQFDMILAPVEFQKPMDPWMIVSEKGYNAVKKITGFSAYKSHEGSNTALSAAYWISILSKETNGFLIENSVVSGKKKVKTVRTLIESDLIYPLVRGRDANKWYSKPSSYIIVPHGRNTGKPLEESSVKVNYSKTFSYFSGFKRDLDKRSIHKLLGKDKPFYSIYDMGSYSFAPYKVVWKDITGKISGKQEIIASVISPHRDNFLGTKNPIIDNTLLGIPVKNLDEAHYLCALLNSLSSRVFVLSYTHLHVRPYVIKKLNLREYDKNNHFHTKLSELSKNAHALAQRYYEENDLEAQEELKEVEEEIDKTVAGLYGITGEELEEVRKTLRVLKGEDVKR